MAKIYLSFTHNILHPPRQVVASGDVLVSMTRPNLNAVAIVPDNLNGQIASTGFDVLRAIEAESRWLYYLVRANDFVIAMSDLVQGALYPAIRPRNIRDYAIPLAPVNEQKRIVDKLDSLFAKLESCRNHLERTSQIIGQFRQSVLEVATSGTLTEDWRDTQSVTDDWKSCSLGDVITDIRYGTAKKSVYKLKNSKPVLRIPNIIDGKIDPSDLKFARFEKKEVKALALKRGDLLLIRSNGSLELVGRTAIVDKDFEGFLYAGYLIRLRFDETKINSQYINYQYFTKSKNKVDIE